MPRYEYRCPDNDQIVEVEHSMSERLTTWGQLCDRAGIDPGKTPRSAKIEKLLSIPLVGRSSAPESSCRLGDGCCGGMCQS